MDMIYSVAVLTERDKIIIDCHKYRLKPVGSSYYYEFEVEDGSGDGFSYAWICADKVLGICPLPALNEREGYY